MGTWTREEKDLALRQLYSDWKDCRACRLHSSRGNTCFGSGRPDADIMLIGEGPGEQEDRQGNVFVGESGVLLNALLEAAGIRRKDLFMTNLIMCRPPEGRSPMKDERESCFPRLWKQIYTVDPILIIPVGKPSMEALMGAKWKSVTAMRGQIGYIDIPGVVEDSVRYAAMPILHPGFILKEDKINRETMNWEHGGYAHKTMKDLIRARQRVEWLKDRYESTSKRELLRIIK